MVYMAKAKYTDSGQLFDSGVDLNMEGGIAELVPTFPFENQINCIITGI